MKTFELSYISNGKCFETIKGKSIIGFMHFFNDWIYDMNMSSDIKSRQMEPTAYKQWCKNTYIKVVVDDVEIKIDDIKWWKDNFITNEDGMIVESKEEKYIKAL